MLILFADAIPGLFKTKTKPEIVFRSLEGVINSLVLAMMKIIQNDDKKVNAIS